MQAFVRGIVLIFLIASSALLNAACADELVDLENQLIGFFEKGDYKQAEIVALKMLKIAQLRGKDVLPDMHADLGIIYLKLRDFPKAIEHWYEGYKTAAAQRRTPLELSEFLNELGRSQFLAKRAEPAVINVKRAIEYREKHLPPGHADWASSVELLGLIYQGSGQYEQAIPQFDRLLKLYSKTLPPTDKQIISLQDYIGTCYSALEKYPEAVRFLEPVYEARKATLSPDDGIYLLLGYSYLQANQPAKAIPLLTTYCQHLEKLHGRNHDLLQDGLHVLAAAHMQTGDYRAAEPLATRVLAFHEARGVADLELAKALMLVAMLDMKHGRHAEAEPRLQRCLKIRQATDEKHAITLETVLHALALVSSERGNLAGSEETLRRAIQARAGGPASSKAESAKLLASLMRIQCLAGKFGEANETGLQAIRLLNEQPDLTPATRAEVYVYMAEGLVIQERYADAVPLLEGALRIRENTFGDEHPECAGVLTSLAICQLRQGDRLKALNGFAKAMSINEKALGAESEEYARSLVNVASLFQQVAPAKSEELLRKALAIFDKKFGPDYPGANVLLQILANVLAKQGKHEAATELFRRVLALDEKHLHPAHVDIADDLANLAEHLQSRGDFDGSKPYAMRLVAKFSLTTLPPLAAMNSLETVARQFWHDGKRPDAISTLENALSLAEQARYQSSGGESDRATYFAQARSRFRLMIDWQIQQNDLDGALQTAERLRARLLVDRLQAQGTDVLSGISEETAKRLRNKQIAIYSILRQTENELNAFKFDKQPGEAQAQIWAELVAKRHFAQEYLAKANDEIYAASRVLSLSAQSKPSTVAEIQQVLKPQRGMLLEFVLGDDKSSVFAVPHDAPARHYELKLSPPAATQLSAKSDALTRDHVKSLMLLDEKPIVEYLGNDKITPAVIERLHLLWNCLIPAELQAALTSNQFANLVIVADDGMANLPFDALVVDPGSDPTWLLDEGPAISYAPSATVLVNLTRRPRPAGRTSVFTIADPAPANSAKPEGDAPSAQRWTASLRALPPLPHSAVESTWLGQAFEKRGTKVDRLSGPAATESAVCARVKDHTLIHFACHGLIQEEYGNFFGGLALAPAKLSPGKIQQAGDDGLLTLAEIYELQLPGCELAILSACQTNCGPDQQGEGPLALSRGFLAAGARRVVASNWLVDDRAAANQVAYYSALLADASAKGEELRYAEQLQTAKRWIRRQEKWKSPYYWATFSLIGPN